MSSTQVARIVMPGQTNSQGSLYGGVLLAMLDEAAAIVARRHSRRDVVTAHVNSVDFEAPILLGELAEVRAKLVKTGRTSMQIELEAYGEDLKTGRRWICTRASLVMVAIDETQTPTPVPPYPASA
ncbi:MAG: acyl-CoA thioesterase [Planctomycetota bacterium]